MLAGESFLQLRCPEDRRVGKQEDFGGADRASVAIDAGAEENTVTNMYSWFFSFAYTEWLFWQWPSIAAWSPLI